MLCQQISFSNEFLLKYSCFIMLCEFLLYCKVNQLHTYMLLWFPKSLSHVQLFAVPMDCSTWGLPIPHRDIYIYPLSFWISFPFRSSQSTEFPVRYSRFLLVICFIHSSIYVWASQEVIVVTNPLANAGDATDAGLIPGSARSPGEGNGNPLQYSCLGNPMDGRA